MIKDRIREFRKNQGLTVREMATMLGKEKTTYEKYEMGGSEPSFETLAKFAEMGLNLHWLITGHGSMVGDNCLDCRAKERELLELHRENKLLRESLAGNLEKRIEALEKRDLDPKLPDRPPRESPHPVSAK